jgi:hypothetical protein
MGLRLELGILAEARRHSAEEFARLSGELDALSQLLAKHELPAHREPIDIDGVGIDLPSYAALVHLKRAAAHLDLNGAWPTPLPEGDDAAAADPTLSRYYQLALEGRRGRFDHLILHDEGAGYYVPIAFTEVLPVPAGSGFAGPTLGSSLSVLAECEDLIRALDDWEPRGLLDPSAAQLEALWAALDREPSAGTGTALEALTAAQLLMAARASVEQRALLAFR